LILIEHEIAYDIVYEECTSASGLKG